jgi:hypothetical protein
MGREDKDGKGVGVEWVAKRAERRGERRGGQTCSVATSCVQARDDDAHRDR